MNHLDHDQRREIRRRLEELLRLYGRTHDLLSGKTWRATSSRSQGGHGTDAPFEGLVARVRQMLRVPARPEGQFPAEALKDDPFMRGLVEEFDRIEAERWEAERQFDNAYERLARMANLLGVDAVAAAKKGRRR